jgi:hypothetical protein
MVTEECVTVVACIDELDERVQRLLAAIGKLSPSELTSRWWRSDPEASPPLRALAKRMDDCLAGFDALQHALGLSADIEPRYGRLLDEVRGGGRAQDERRADGPAIGGPAGRADRALPRPAVVGRCRADPLCLVVPPLDVALDPPDSPGLPIELDPGAAVGPIDRLGRLARVMDQEVSPGQVMRGRNNLDNL